eukprot:CAMPEP_0204154294 /NCGR_PEP_ID=MMETSP0361-20130328/28596_1 /ASSEMBLY_ACC=CAM_ASM_000343 /TAXON_ID=268821 /ORGANISM="Scrippsiella Hangoei, Strain SHTV-5" /LENGTH=379 /DNA_ID=CAMNT_0051109547 /DNA_START=33 /DNA_END=1169 /DNA_ORIENTATION=-
MSAAVQQVSMPIMEQRRRSASDGQVRACKLFLGGLTRNTTTKDLRDHFSQYGRVLDCIAMRQPDGRSRGFGYVTLDSLAAADRCLMENEAENDETPEKVELMRAPLNNITNLLKKGGFGTSPVKEEKEEVVAKVETTSTAGAHAGAALGRENRPPALDFGDDEEPNDASTGDASSTDDATHQDLPSIGAECKFCHFSHNHNQPKQNQQERHNGSWHTAQFPGGAYDASIREDWAALPPYLSSAVLPSPLAGGVTYLGAWTSKVSPSGLSSVPPGLLAASQPQKAVAGILSTVPTPSSSAALATPAGGLTSTPKAWTTGRTAAAEQASLETEVDKVGREGAVALRLGCRLQGQLRRHQNQGDAVMLHAGTRECRRHVVTW